MIVYFQKVEEKGQMAQDVRWLPDKMGGTLIQSIVCIKIFIKVFQKTAYTHTLQNSWNLRQLWSENYTLKKSRFEGRSTVNI